MSQVSVIVPVYNVEQYIRRCVDSILAQTFTDFELILVDDGSPDNCSAICDEYAAKDCRVRVIHKENGGVSSARNAGLDVAQGEYIAFCDSDDWLDSDFLSSLHNAIIKSNADVSVSQFRILGQNGEAKNSTRHESGFTDYSLLSNKFDFLVNVAGGRHGWEIWTRMFRASIIRQNNIRFCTSCQNYAEDLGFVLEYSLFSNSQISLDYCGYNYLEREASMMRSSKNVLKLDQLNEVSYHVYGKFRGVFEYTKFIRYYSIVHFLLLRIELQKIVGTSTYQKLRDEINQTQNPDWLCGGLRGIYAAYTKLKQYYPKEVCQKIVLLSHYCIHKNWKRFRYESAIAYKLFIKG